MKSGLICLVVISAALVLGLAVKADVYAGEPSKVVSKIVEREVAKPVTKTIVERAVVADEACHDTSSQVSKIVEKVVRPQRLVEREVLRDYATQAVVVEREVVQHRPLRILRSIVRPERIVVVERERNRRRGAERVIVRRGR